MSITLADPDFNVPKMPFFSRRRIQAMLDDLSSKLTDEKCRDLLGRLSDKRYDQLLSAEIELSLLWAIWQTGDIEIDPEWLGKGGADAYTETLAELEPTVVEIVTHSDGRISYEAAMEHIATQVTEYVRKSEPGLADYLYFIFDDEISFGKNGSFRAVKADVKYSLSSIAKDKIHSWIKDKCFTDGNLEISEAGTAFQIKKLEHRQHKYHNFHTHMLPRAFSMENNPLFEALKRKLKQLKTPKTGAQRVIFIADTGSRLLSEIGRYKYLDGSGNKTGTEIINHFVEKYRDRVEAVVVFSAQYDRNDLNSFGRGHRWWQVTVFKSMDCEVDFSGIEKIREILPSPRLEGHQIRSMAQQRSFDPKRNQDYFSMTTIWKRGDNSVTIKLSSRALLDFLAGRIDEATFRLQVDKRVFNTCRDRGESISDICLESGGIDRDDDQIVLHFEKDSATSEFRRNPVNPKSKA